MNKEKRQTAKKKSKTVKTWHVGFGVITLDEHHWSFHRGKAKNWYGSLSELLKSDALERAALLAVDDDKTLPEALEQGMAMLIKAEKILAKHGYGVQDKTKPKQT